MSRTAAVSTKKASSKQRIANQKSTKQRQPSTKPLAEQEEDRQQMIATAAYFRAEHRGFDGGDPVVDWLDAEAEIDAMLTGNKSLNIH